MLRGAFHGGSRCGTGGRAFLDESVAQHRRLLQIEPMRCSRVAYPDVARDARSCS